MDSRIEAYIERCEPWQQKAFYFVRELILDSHPAIQEKYTYMCPFYHLNGLLCYFSVQKKGTRTALGLCEGALMQDTYNMLKSEEKQSVIRHIYLDPNNMPAADQIRAYLFQAIDINLNKTHS